MSVYIHDSGSEAQESGGNDEEKIFANDINEESIECIVKKALQKNVTKLFLLIIKWRLHQQQQQKMTGKMDLHIW